MKDLRKAQIAAGKIESKYARFGSLPWNEVYGSEKEIVEDLAKVHVPANNDFGGAVSRLYNGYEYIHSFARRVQNGSNLTESQMMQAKRLAKEIKKAAAVAEFY